MNTMENTICETIFADDEYMSAHPDLQSGCVTRADLREFQLYRLNQVMDNARKHARGYAQTLPSSSINCLHDFTAIPFTTADMLRHGPYSFLCVPLGGVVRTFTHFTTGTSGRPKKILFSASDLEKINRNMKGIISSILSSSHSLPQETKIGIYLPHFGRPLSMADMIARAASELGCQSYDGSCEDIAEEQLAEVLREKPQMLMGSAFRLWRMTQEAAAAGMHGHSSVKTIFITSEYMAPVMRKRMEKIWGAEVYHHYGMTEPGFAIGIECGEHKGYHWNEADLYFEVIDPDTGEVLPDGEEGELVLTTLDREAMPLIRYRTGDIASIHREECSCSPLLSSIGTLFKRIGLIHPLSTGEEIYTALTDESMYAIEELVDYRLYLEDGEAGDVLRCSAELIGPEGEDVSSRIRQALLTVPEIERAVSAGGLTLEAEIVPRGSLRRGGRTMKRKIVDSRAAYTLPEPSIDLAKE